MAGDQTANFLCCISNTWDGRPLSKQACSDIVLQSGSSSHLTVQVRAPFYNDPQAPQDPQNPQAPLMTLKGVKTVATQGEPFQQLWDYEVVELFFLNDKNQYLEVEICPHGQYLCLLLNGCRKIVKDMLPMKFRGSLRGREWLGECDIPMEYFPPNVSRFNAYAIHGSGKEREYQALYPATPPHTEPDFHRLEYFKELDFAQLLPVNHSSEYSSSLWTEYIS